MKDADKLQDIVAIARDGERFYDEAGKEVKDPSLKMLFMRMADHKRHLIKTLSNRLSVHQEEVPAEGTLVGKMRRIYADLRASMAKDEAEIYVSQLEETEDRLLDYFEQALKDVDDAAVRAALLRHMPEVRACHDQMRDLKQRMAA